MEMHHPLEILCSDNGGCSCAQAVPSTVPARVYRSGPIAQAVATLGADHFGLHVPTYSWQYIGVGYGSKHRLLPGKP